MLRKPSFQQSQTIVIGLGSNAFGAWGSPRATVCQAILQLPQIDVNVICTGELYVTRPIGGGRQLHFINTVVLATSAIPAATLLKRFKRLEHAAGRRRGRHWGPRPLDVDLLDYRGQVNLWIDRSKKRQGLVLPHPEMHRRAFVLEPLVRLAPWWRHPVLDQTAQQLLARADRTRGDVIEIGSGTGSPDWELGE